MRFEKIEEEDDEEARKAALRERMAKISGGMGMFGMMGIDWAYGFDKINGSSQYGGSQFHFILGQEF